MLEKLGEWYCIVTPNPKQGMLEMRKASIPAIISALSKERKSLMPEAISGLVYRFESNTKIASIIADAIREQDLAFPAGVEENNEELKVMTAIALGDILKNPNNIAN